MIDIVRERLFIQHDYQKQRGIVAEYTIRSNRDDLSNLIFLSEDFLPNLLVVDESNSVLSVMPSDYVNTLLDIYYNDSSGAEKDKIGSLISKIQDNKLHLIWVKIPEKSKLVENEIRTITLSYSSTQAKKEPVLRMKVKNKNYPLYYTLYTPSDFDFEKTQYDYLKRGQIVSTHTRPEYVETFRTYNSRLFRIVSDIESGFEISYSFKPTTQSTMATKIGLITLSLLGFAVLVLKLAVHYGGMQFDILEKEVEIGLLTIGGSLVLPQLTGNDSIRMQYTKYYILPIALGAMILAW